MVNRFTTRMVNRFTKRGCDCSKFDCPILKKKYSIHDIARELGVSATTISFVLKGNGQEKKVSAPVRQRILSYIESIGYQPNQVAQSLRTGKSKIIGMLVEDISDPFFSSIGRIVEDSLYKFGYKIFHASTDNDTDRAKKLLQLFRDRQVDGYIMAPAPGIEKEILELLHESKPIVVFDRYFPELPTTNVVIDNKAGAYAATLHLIENGFRHIAFVTLNSEQVQMNDRLKGFNIAIEEYKLEYCCLKLNYKTSAEELTSSIKKFIKKNKEVDAVLFGTNYLAVSGLKAIQELGLKIPEDIGMVGFDDNTHFALFTPSITAVSQPVDQISKKVVQLLINALSDSKSAIKPKTYTLSAELIVRESSVRSLVKTSKKSKLNNNLF